MSVETTYSESELISLILANNKAAFDHLYTRYAAALRYCITYFIADDHAAEHILHDSFVNIWTTIRLYNPDKSSFYTWIHTIAKNNAINSQCSTIHKTKITTVGNEGCMETCQYALPQTGKTALNKVATKLPRDPKELVHLVYCSGHSIKEISSNLNMPESTVKTRLRDAIKNLRKEFGIVSC